MALINCQECRAQVSDRAGACPRCGHPMAIARESAGAGTALTTIQATSKRLKAHTAIAATLVIMSTFGVVISASDAGKGFWILVALIGLAWLIVTRVRIWWHHD